LQLADRGDEAIRDLARFRSRRLREENDELIAGISADHARAADLSPQRLGDGLEHDVTLKVAVAVVDGLEFVDVDDEERHVRVLMALAEYTVRGVDERPAHLETSEIVR